MVTKEAKGKEGQKRKKRREKRPGRWLRRLGVFALVLAAAAGVLWLVRIDLHVEGYGNIMAADDAVLRAGVKAAVKEMLASTGQMVTKGQVLVKLEDSQQRADLLRVQRSLQQAQAELLQLRHHLAVLRAEQQAAIKVAKVELAAAKDELDARRKLLAKRVATEQEYRRFKLAYDLALAKLKSISIERGDLWAAQLEVKRRQIAKLQADRLLCLDQVALRQVGAPIAGKVVMHDISPGQVVDANQVLGQVFDESSYCVMARIPEGMLWFVRPGQRVEVETSAYPESRFGYLTGKVQWLSVVINPQATGDGTVLLRAKLDAPKRKDVILKPGMSSSVRVLAGKTRLLWRLLPMRVFELTRPAAEQPLKGPVAAASQPAR